VTGGVQKLFRGPVVWREPVSLFGPLGWIAATAWPPIVFTLVIFAPTKESGGLLNDWRLKALVAGAVAIAAILWIVKGERERDGSPSTRLGILSRFLLFGFIFSLGALILLVLAFSVMTVFGSEGFLPTLGEIESTLFLFGVAGLPPALMVGVSYAVWAGLMVSLVSFTPKVERSRPRPSPLFDLTATDETPPPPAPVPETPVEAGLRPDLGEPRP